MRGRAQSGVTLMELLIAVSLLSLLSVGILVAMRVGLNALERANDRLYANRRVVGAQRILDQQIAGMIAATANCRPDPSRPPARAAFFQGEPQAMRFVTSYSLEQAHRGYPQIVEYSVIPGESGQGVRLVVNEIPYAGPESAGALCLGPSPDGQGMIYRPIETGPRSFVLADRLAFCRFQFQARKWPSSQTEWLPAWSLPLLPSAIRIEMQSLEADSARLPLLTMTAPVHVVRDPLSSYAD